ncbi:MAG: SulP family inorganic anion transporter [Marivibrio sp.]|uniref:SulP family inorganic anion transporter n=1 Tax=Marivibrio sp. TaxID=2039719 RepID=UPI0032F038DF
MAERVGLSDVAAGGLIAVLFVTTAVSNAALIFAGLPPSYFLTGVTLMLVATLIGAVGGAILSGFYAPAIGPRSGLAPAYAGLVAGVAASASPGAAGVDQFATIVAAMMTATLATGVILFALGWFRLGGLVRYIPYPVMGGFFAGIGFLFLRGGVEVAAGAEIALADLPDFVGASAMTLAAPALAFGVIAYLLQRLNGHWTVTPGVILGALVLFYAALWTMEMSPAEAAAAGWLPQVGGETGGWPAFTPADLSGVDWGAVLGEAAAIGAIAMLAAIILLLEVSGIEIVGECELNPNRELKAAGLINLANGGLAGFAAAHSASEAALAVKMGAGSRVVGAVFAAVVLATLALGTDFIGYVPNFVLGGLLVFLGLNFLIDWLWTGRRDMPGADYAAMVAILAVIGAVGLLEGVAFGLAVATVLFVVSYSRLSIVKGEMTARDHASHVVRSADARAVLEREANRVRILKLQGFIFFGTADSLLERVRARLADEATRFDYLVLDFKHVSRLDSSAVQAFAKLKRLADREDVAVVLTDLRPPEHRRLEAIGFFRGSAGDGAPRDPDRPPRLSLSYLDDGVAWCEMDILRAGGVREESEGATLEDQLAAVLESRTAAAAIVPYFERRDADAGAYLFHQGDPGDSLYLLSEGVASVVISPDGKAERAIRIFQRGTLLGEMALYTHGPRTASVRIDEPCLLFRLTRESFEAMQREAPQAAGLFHAYVVRLLAERLERANRELRQVS